MGFVESMSASSSAAATASNSNSNPGSNDTSPTDAAVVFTTEEISMFQEMFLNSNAAAAAFEPLKIVVDDAALVSDKDFQISDIAILDGALALKADELMLGAGDDATSVLLSPIGSDETFLNQFLFDEKDAMAAFYTEAIDPFQSPSPIKVESSTTTAASPLARPSAEHEQTLAKLRSKVEALSKMYYTRCHRLQSGSSDDSAVDVSKVKLVHALEKLQRIAAGLAAQNAQLVVDTTSAVQQREAAVEKHSAALSDASVLEQIIASIDETACAAAIAAATQRMTEFAIAGDARDVMGWQHRSAVSADHVVSYQSVKSYPCVEMQDVMRKTWECVSSSVQFSALLGAHARVQVLKTLGTDAAVLLHDVANHDATRIDRVLSLMFRAELPNNRFVLGACSINPTSVPAAGAAAGASVRWMDCSMWQIHEKRSESEHVVTVGGSSAYASQAEAHAMALESVCSLLRWESATIGAPFAFAL